MYTFIGLRQRVKYKTPNQMPQLESRISSKLGSMYGEFQETSLRKFQRHQTLKYRI